MFNNCVTHLVLVPFLFIIALYVLIFQHVAISVFAEVGTRMYIVFLVIVLAAKIFLIFYEISGIGF